MREIKIQEEKIKSFIEKEEKDIERLKDQILLKEEKISKIKQSFESALLLNSIQESLSVNPAELQQSITRQRNAPIEKNDLVKLIAKTLEKFATEAKGLTYSQTQGRMNELFGTSVVKNTVIRNMKKMEKANYLHVVAEDNPRSLRYDLTIEGKSNLL